MIAYRLEMDGLDKVLCIVKAVCEMMQSWTDFGTVAPQVSLSVYLIPAFPFAPI